MEEQIIYCEHVYKNMNASLCPICGKDTHEYDWDYLTKSSFILNSENKYQMNYDPSIIHGMQSKPSKPKNASSIE